jgi:tRNA dimethylallyltransferase
LALLPSRNSFKAIIAALKIGEAHPIRPYLCLKVCVLSENLKNPLLILIVGPTASGKTALAIHLAKKFDTEIVSADSRQVYRELPIGTAMPTAHELAEVQHHFIADRSLKQHLNAGVFEREGNKRLAELFQKKQVIIACGGSGLFLKALVEGFDDIAPRDEVRRKHWQKIFEKEGIAPLQQALQNMDPAYAASADMQNHQRLIRALEVIESSGKPYSTQRQATPKSRPYDCLWIGLSPERSLLNEHIHQRVDAMIHAGLEEEAKAVYIFREAEALRTVGYVEFFDYFDGKTDLPTAIETIKINTRQYARRQMTWFRRNPAIHWFPSADAAEIAPFIAKFIAER